MINHVEFMLRKLAMVEKVVNEAPEKVARSRRDATADDEPLFEYDDDYYHPLAGDPLTIILLAEATQRILEVHKANISGDCYVCSLTDGYEPSVHAEFPCATVKALATGWGWTWTIPERHQLEESP